RTWDPLLKRELLYQLSYGRISTTIHDIVIEKQRFFNPVYQPRPVKRLGMPLVCHEMGGSIRVADIQDIQDVS
ncbi:MAG: hypothetical protein AAB581_02310, partial [Patescibacteria group bacterium]